MSELKEFCGIFGIYGHEQAAIQAYYGLYSLQHRGQESAGIVVSDGHKVRSKKGLGLLSEAIHPDDLAPLHGNIAIGHLRYSTTGRNRVQNIQPLISEYSQGLVAVAHNGNIVNSRSLRREYEARGSIFQTSTDSEVIIHLLADPACIAAANPLAHALQKLLGSFSLVLMTPNRLMAARDPQGFRPLSLGKLGAATVVSSETCTFDLLGAEFVRDVEPGEIVMVDSDGVHSSFYADRNTAHAHCVFEHIYFARPDSVVFGQTVHSVRVRLGQVLAAANQTPADVVISVPDSGNSAASGFAMAAGLPLDQGFIRNHYVGRTFILPAEEDRDKKVQIKLNVVREVVNGKRVVVVDDSIVRGTTGKARLDQLRRAGAKEIHLRVSSPPIRFPCYYGIDFPSSGELIADNRSIQDIADAIGADTLIYQSIPGLLKALQSSCCKQQYCLACFNGQYPLPVTDNMEKEALEGIETS